MTCATVTVSYPKNPPCFGGSHPSPNLLATMDLSFCSHTFAFSGMLHNWSHTGHSLFRLACFFHLAIWIIVSSTSICGLIALFFCWIIFHCMNVLIYFETIMKVILVASKFEQLGMKPLCMFLTHKSMIAGL
jgi:hypothetical protein